MRDYLLTRLQQLHTLIAELDEKAASIARDRTIAAAQRDAYQDALDHSPEQARNTKKHGRSGVRSGAWREVFKYLAQRWPDTVTNDEMMAYIMAAGHHLTRQALRAQLSTYTQKGALERVGDGVYRITREGRVELGIAEPFDTETETAADSQSTAASEPLDAERV